MADQGFVHFLTVVALPVTLAAVLGVLIFGLIALNRPGEQARETSQKLMRWRVGIHIFAIALILLIVILKQTAA